VISQNNDRPIIVLGCPRSGTTLLQVMLHSHPRIAIPPETRFLLPAYRNRLRFRSLEAPANRRALGRFIARTRGNRFGDLGLERRKTIRQIVKGPPTLGSALGIVFRGYAERFDRPRWGDKRPAYHHYIEAIMRLFPDAQIVHIVRDPRDCVASITRMPWWDRDSYHAVSAWAQSIDHTDEAARKWPGAITRVQYELLVADPETELKALCAALGEQYDPAMAEPERVAPIAVPDRKHWHGYTRQSPTTQRVGRWRADLEPWEVALCETVLGDRMQRFGYEPTGAGRPPLEHLARFARAHAARKLVREKRLVHDRWIRRREQNPVAAVLTAGQRRAAHARRPPGYEVTPT
jgi:Sulfotransferase family